MPFKIVRNDITKMDTEAIVNTANPYPRVGSGTDTNIYKAAGYDQLLEARKEIGTIEPGEAIFTEGFGLKSKFIIHTAGPLYKDGKHNEEKILRNCYRNCLDIAYELGCKSISFPLISSGNYGYPKDEALNIALSEINDFLLNTDFSDDDELSDMDVYLVIYDEGAFDLSSRIYSDIQSFIDQNYIEQNYKNEFLSYGKEHQKIKYETENSCTACLSLVTPDLNQLSLEDFMEAKKEPFQDILMRLIAERNLANKDVYKRANIDAKLFSKIICNKDYVPKKSNVMALAIGLKLNLQEAEEFLTAAGFAFSPSNKTDLIVKYFIQNGNYDMRDLEEKMYALTGKTLGNLA